MSYNRDENVIPFEQDGAFYYKKARRYMDNNNFIRALSYYRKAVEKSPDSKEYLLELAELFTEMNFYEESNKLLVRIIYYLDKDEARAYFDMGCNFLGLRDYERAKKAFKRYLDIDPDGVYTEEVEDCLNVLDMQAIYMKEMADLNKKTRRLYRKAHEGKELLDKGEYDKAIVIFEEIIKQDSTLLFVKNNLSLAYFCIGDIGSAIELEREVLAINENNVHANCNIALYYDELGDTANRDRYLKKVEMLISDDPDDLYKIGVTLCELEHHDEALKVFDKLLDYNPYDTKALFYCGIANMNMMQYKNAMECWDKIIKLNHGDSIVEYYKSRTRLHMDKIIPYEQYKYHYQVPHDEFIRRLKSINELLMLSDEELKELWKTEQSVRTLLTWGLGLDDDVLKETILHIIGDFGDKNSEMVLREFLLKKDESEAVKKEVLELLKRNGCKEPYVAYMKGRLTEVRADIIENANELYSLYKEAVEIAVDNMKGRYECDYIGAIRNIMEIYLKNTPLKHLARIRRKEVWAGALEYYYCRDNHIPIRMVDIAQRYSVSLSSISITYRQLTKGLLRHI